jgi:hypothetical protein
MFWILLKFWTWKKEKRKKKKRKEGKPLNQMTQDKWSLIEILLWFLILFTKDIYIFFKWAGEIYFGLNWHVSKMYFWHINLIDSIERNFSNSILNFFFLRINHSNVARLKLNSIWTKKGVKQEINLDRNKFVCVSSPLL